MADEAEVRAMLNRTGLKVLKGKLESKFDPYALSKKREIKPVGERTAESASLDGSEKIVEPTPASQTNFGVLALPFRSKTEKRFAERLIAAGSQWFFEPITLCVSRVGKRKLTYTPDFLIVEDDRLTFIEIKGGFIRDKSIRNFDMAVQQYGHIFDFEMWQQKNKNSEWNCIRRSN